MLPMIPPVSNPRTMLRKLVGFFGRLGSSGASGTGASEVPRSGSDRKPPSSSRVARPPLRKPPPPFLAATSATPRSHVSTRDRTATETRQRFMSSSYLTEGSGTSGRARSRGGHDGQRMPGDHQVLVGRDHPG